MEPVDMTYNLCSMEEPTENQLQQIMREACEDAIIAKVAAMEKLNQQLERDVREAQEKYDKVYGKS